MSETHDQPDGELPDASAAESSSNSKLLENADPSAEQNPPTPSMPKTENLKSQKKRADKTPAARALSRVLLLIFNVILLGGIGGLGFMYWEQQKALDLLFTEYNAATAQQNTFTRLLEDVESKQADQLSALQEQVANAAQQLLAHTSELENVNRELVSTRLKISQQSGEADGSWMLNEAESLLRLARQRLLNARDLNTALSLMLSADDVLKQMNDPAVQSVRSILLSDMDALRSVRLPDIQAMHQRLGSLVPQLDALSLVAENGTARTFVAPDNGAGNIADDSSWLDDIKQSLGQYFVISREGAPVMPQASPEQLMMTRQLARLQLEQARIALLQGDAQVYRATLDQLFNVVETTMQGEGKASLLRTLSGLRDASINATIPATGNALNALRQITPVESVEGVVQ